MKAEGCPLTFSVRPQVLNCLSDHMYFDQMGQSPLCGHNGFASMVAAQSFVLEFDVPSMATTNRPGVRPYWLSNHLYLIYKPHYLYPRPLQMDMVYICNDNRIIGILIGWPFYNRGSYIFTMKLFIAFIPLTVFYHYSQQNRSKVNCY